MNYWFVISQCHHLPPLAYSITRYKVFSVSITSKSLTGSGEREAAKEDRGGINEWRWVKMRGMGGKWSGVKATRFNLDGKFFVF